MGGWSLLKIVKGTAKTGAAVLGVGAGGYTAYNYFANDVGMLETWGRFALGNKTVDKIEKDGAAETVGDFFLGDGGSEKAVEKGKELVSGVGDALGGVKEGAEGLFGGFGKLLGGIFGGGTSSLVGLIAAGLMFFGNFGWMGKIVCGLVAAMSFGLFGGNSQQQATIQQTSVAEERGQREDYSRYTEGNDEETGYVINRPRR